MIHAKDGERTRCGLRADTMATWDQERVTCRTCLSLAPSRKAPVWPARIESKPWCARCGMSEGHWRGCSDA